ncbi:hypothetical protein D9611_001412 [Ephemerocybe angulata]|uniref:Uncharacterized protein n=1 Tax=Ephemerocybe angulata TaxID=980116 RepID=A0A8H5CIP8_9AGAR|nr:hypothetical protein D9611_001412 [Tulosesus angulatus]
MPPIRNDHGEQPAADNGYDTDEELGGEGLPSNGFRTCDLQLAVGLDGGEFKSFKKSISTIMVDCFDVRFLLGEQLAKRRVFDSRLKDAYPSIMGVNDPARKRLVTQYLSCLYGNWRFKHRKSIATPKPSALNGSGLSMTKNTTKKHAPKEHDHKPAAASKNASSSSSTSSWSNPPLGSAANPFTISSESGRASQPKRQHNKKINRSNHISSHRRNKPGMSVALPRIQRAPSVEMLDAPPRPKLPIADTAPSPASEAKFSDSLPSAAQNQIHPGCSGVFTVGNPPIQSALFTPLPYPPPDAPEQNPRVVLKKEILSKYSATPALETEGILYFLRDHKPSLEKFLPALALFGCKLSWLKVLSTRWKSDEIENLWIQKLREKCIQHRLPAPDDMEGAILHRHLRDFWERHD